MRSGGFENVYQQGYYSNTTFTPVDKETDGTYNVTYIMKNLTDDTDTSIPLSLDLRVIDDTCISTLETTGDSHDGIIFDYHIGADPIVLQMPTHINGLCNSCLDVKILGP